MQIDEATDSIRLCSAAAAVWTSQLALADNLHATADAAVAV